MTSSWWLTLATAAKTPALFGSKGQREKDVVLSIAQLLAKRLKREKGFDVKLVRNDDFFVPLRKRVEIAHKHNADMFISVHADAGTTDHRIGGFGVCLVRRRCHLGHGAFHGATGKRRRPAGRQPVC